MAEIECRKLLVDTATQNARVAAIAEVRALGYPHGGAEPCPFYRRLTTSGYL